MELGLGSRRQYFLSTGIQFPSFKDNVDLQLLEAVLANNGERLPENKIFPRERTQEEMKKRLSVINGLNP